MKFNKWTLGLAALGVVSLASAVKADEKAAPTYLETAVSQTQISGYLGVSAVWGMNNNPASQYGTYYGSNTKSDNFNLDAVSVQIQKPLDETDWAAGYNFQLVYGQDASSVGVNLYGNGATATIKNAYVELRTPLGNGIDWKIGVFDTILGYEGFDRGGNPNYSYSYGYNLEPTTYAGILGSYKVCDALSVQAGVANNPGTGAYNTGYGYSPLSSSGTDSRKTYLGSVALTAPQSWGVLAGSTLYGAVAYGGYSAPYNSDSYTYTSDVANFYVGTVVNTGVKGLKVGASYDYQGTKIDERGNTIPTSTTWADALALYSSFQVTDKLSVHGRAEYAWQNGYYGQNCESVYALTGTVQYDLWKNVLSRVELRWDHRNNTTPGTQGFTSSNNKDAVMLAANLIYKF